MSNKQLGMEKIRQVLRCYSQGYGTKSISSMLTVSRNTVKKYLQVFQRSGLDYEGVLSLSDQELSELFHEKTRVKTESERMEELKSLLPEYCKRLQKKGVTREALHREYLSSHPDGYGRTRFYILIQQHIACSRPIMYLEHKAGDKVFIDFAGDKLSIIDLDTGEIICRNSALQPVNLCGSGHEPEKGGLDLCFGKRLVILPGGSLCHHPGQSQVRRYQEQ